MLQIIESRLFAAKRGNIIWGTLHVYYDAYNRRSLVAASTGTEQEDDAACYYSVDSFFYDLIVYEYLLNMW